MTERWTFSEESEPVAQATVTLVEGASFVICDAGGDISGVGVDGLFVADTRVCSRLVLTVDDRQVEALAVAPRSPFSACFVGRTADRCYLVMRDMWVGAGLRVDTKIRNLTKEPRVLVARLDLASDLAELFAVKEGRTAREVISVERTVGDGELRFTGANGRRGLVAHVEPDAVVAADGSFRWRIEIGPGEEWMCCTELSAIRGAEALPPRYRCGDPVAESVPVTRQALWEQQLPRLHTDVTGLEEAFERAHKDLGALRLFDPDYPDQAVLAAGAPWFMTLFGRDSILTSWMALPLDAGLAVAICHALARLQGTKDDPESEEQPGRILHEVRFGRGPSLSLAGGDVYYGSVDATPLFVMLVHELWMWGVPLDDIKPLLPAVDAALAWMAGPGDPDGDGFIEYQRRSPHGLMNQAWKDSFDGISFADGRMPESPIAVAEVQGYAYAAWRAGAALAAAVGDDTSARHRERRASELQARFDRDFWMPDRQAFALALDGDKNQVDAVGSNMGHCLWTGVVADPDKAAAVARWLVSPELFSGWGVRTLATSMAHFNPLSYHNGSVWPHDTAICIAGLRRAGFVDEAMRVGEGLLAAASASMGRLPELFGGLSPAEFPAPVPYPASCSPQAWASASSLLILRAMLGFEPDVPGGRLELDPVLPEGASSLRIDNLPVAGAHITIEVKGDALAVRGLPRGLALLRPGA